MKTFCQLLLLLLPVLLVHTALRGQANEKVLIFSKTGGYRHWSIRPGINAIKRLGKTNHFLVDATESTSIFTEAGLSQYKALIFLNPTGSDLFNEQQKAAIRKFINRGGGFVGIHAAADCCYEWSWYGKMLGGYFKSHPPIQKALLRVVDRDHPSTDKLPAIWEHKDEWYNFKFLNRDEMRVLILLDERSYKGGENGTSHPISWYHDFEGGRVFYTGLGHSIRDYVKDSLFLGHLLGGIEYALGRHEKNN